MYSKDTPAHVVLRGQRNLLNSAVKEFSFTAVHARNPRQKVHHTLDDLLDVLIERRFPGCSHVRQRHGTLQLRIYHDVPCSGRPTAFSCQLKSSAQSTNATNHTTGAPRGLCPSARSHRI